MNGLVRLLLHGVAVFVAAYLIPGIAVTNFAYALLVALILLLVNVTIKPILQILTFPITIISLGLFLLVFNALMVLLVDSFLKDFYVNGFWSALFFSIVSSLTFWVLEALFSDSKKKKEKYK